MPSTNSISIALIINEQVRDNFFFFLVFDIFELLHKELDDLILLFKEVLGCN